MAAIIPPGLLKGLAKVSPMKGIGKSNAASDAGPSVPVKAPVKKAPPNLVAASRNAMAAKKSGGLPPWLGKK